jgi:hypothetical protein
MRLLRAPIILIAIAGLVAGLSASLPAPALSQDSVPARKGLIRKQPYLIYTGDNTEMEVHWQLNSSAAATIVWGPEESYALGWQTTAEYGIDHQHRCTISNLIPGNRYFYRVITEGEICSGSFHAGPPTDATDLKFLVYGDTRSYPADHDDVAAAMVSTFTDEPDFQTLIVCAGDLVNRGYLEEDWDTQFFSPIYSNIRSLLAHAPYHSCMGNHELPGALFAKYFPYPDTPGLYWSFDYGPAHFVFINQYISYEPGSAQLTWLAADLAATRKKWKIIVLHEPGWSAGHHENNSDVQDYIQPLCEIYQVSVVMAGHNHYYARAEVNGVQHITTGGGGAPLYAPNPGYPNVVECAEEHHFCRVAITGDLLTFAAVTPALARLDTFSVRFLTDVEPESSPPSLVFHPPFPNPFNPAVVVPFSLTRQQRVTISIHDLRGRQVTTVVDATYPAGTHSTTWRGTDAAGHLVAAGSYLVRLRAGNLVESRKIMLAR